MQIDQTVLAHRAADLLQVKLDVLSLWFGEHTEQEAAEFFAAGATDPLLPPDSTNRMRGVRVTVDQMQKSLLQRMISSQSSFELGHQTRLKALIEKCEQLLIGDRFVRRIGHRPLGSLKRWRIVSSLTRWLAPFELTRDSVW